MTILPPPHPDYLTLKEMLRQQAHEAVDTAIDAGPMCAEEARAVANALAAICTLAAIHKRDTIPCPPACEVVS